MDNLPRQVARVEGGQNGPQFEAGVGNLDRRATKMSGLIRPQCGSTAKTYHGVLDPIAQTEGHPIPSPNAELDQSQSKGIALRVQLSVADVTGAAMYGDPVMGCAYHSPETLADWLFQEGDLSST